jgi:hypothetical protein
MVWGAIGWG